jgi:hypothetical protein
MTIFNRGNDVLLEEKLAAIRNEFQGKLNAQAKQFELEMDELEADLIKRIELGDKSVSGDSLRKTKDQPEEQRGGYTPWSQRKSHRMQGSRDPDFPNRVLKRTQK